jgi:hypothetical protein
MEDREAEVVNDTVIMPSFVTRRLGCIQLHAHGEALQTQIEVRANSAFDAWGV